MPCGVVLLYEESSSSGVRARAACCRESYEPGTTSSRPSVEQRQLPLLGIEAPQRADNRCHALQLVSGILRVELAALDPLWIALPPQGEFPLGLGNLLSKSDHGLSPFLRGVLGLALLPYGVGGAAAARSAFLVDVAPFVPQCNDTVQIFCQGIWRGRSIGRTR